MKISSCNLPTEYGDFTLMLFKEKDDLIAVLAKEPAGDIPLIRIHSQCFTSETLGSLRCDCDEQLHAAMAALAKEGGYLLYLFQEGRGIGLAEKIKAYALQDAGKDTYEANIALGHQPDLREYSAAAAVLKDLGINRVRMLTNNPDKISQLEKNGIMVDQRIPLSITPNKHNEQYLRIKKQKFGHFL